MFLLASLPLEKVYLGCGIFGATIFIVRTILMLIGADSSDADLDDFSDAGNIDGDFDGDSDVDVDPGLRLLTVQGLMAFIMMFGFTGYAITTGSTLGAGLALIASVAVGAFTMWLVARLMRLMQSLQSSGTTSLDAAVGEEGTVYLSIPADGIGKVQVKVGEALKVIDARAEDKQPIPTGERVSVAYTMDGRTLVVNKVAD